MQNRNILGVFKNNRPYADKFIFNWRREGEEENC